MNGIKVDAIRKTIIISKGFAQKAQNPMTTEFDILAKVQNAYPTFYIEKKNAKEKSVYQSINGKMIREFIDDKHKADFNKWDEALKIMKFSKVKADFYEKYEKELKAYLNEKKVAEKEKKAEQKDQGKVLDLTA